MYRVVLVVATLSSYSSSTDVVDWSEWRVPTESESMLSHATIGRGTAFEFTKLASYDSNGSLREQWSWDTGEMRVLNLGPNHFMERQSKKALQRFVAAISSETGLEVAVERSDVKRARNQLGNYSYAEVDGRDQEAADPDVTCFFFLQYFGDQVSAGGSHTPSGVFATNLLQGVDCQPTASIGDHGDTMHLFMNGLARQ